MPSARNGYCLSYKELPLGGSGRLSGPGSMALVVVAAKAGDGAASAALRARGAIGLGGGGSRDVAGGTDPERVLSVAR